jgi:hypothetical protein
MILWVYVLGIAAMQGTQHAPRLRAAGKRED